MVRAQAAVATLGAAIAWWYGGPRAAFSVLVGGAICAVPGAIMISRMFRPAADAAAALRAFYAGEIVKIALTVAMFAGAILYLEVDVLLVLVSYAATLAVYWVALVTTAGGSD